MASTLVAKSREIIMKSKTLQHLNPIWGEKANFIIGARLSQDVSETEIRWEQLWSRKISDGIFEICCIPFFVYNISLGDEVRTDAEHWITGVTKPSGHFTFRVWFGDSTNTTIRDEVNSKVEELQCLFEWYSCNLMAIDTPTDSLAKMISNYLQEKEDSGLLTYETGRI
jgi:Domain of unknown function (DUF4265)